MRISDWSSDVCSSDLVAKGQRLALEDVAWLRTEAEYCWTDELQKAWHGLEAQALTEAWDRTGDAWNAVNASGHWRKAGDAERALSLTEKALARTSLPSKLRSALATTRGGAMRDLHQLEEAEALGRQAQDRKSTRLNSSHYCASRKPTSA